MDTQIYPKVKINGVGSYLPPQIVYSDDLMAEIHSDERYNLPINWIRTVMGIEERRVADSDAKPSDLAIPAAQEALDNCKDISPEDIDLIIFCGIERDQPEPATAHTIQNALGLNARHAFDLGNACFGFIDALEVASNYIKCGIVSHALIVTGEVPSRVMGAAINRLKIGVEIETARNIVGALSVGDAGGAVVVGASCEDDPSGFELFNVHSYSWYVEQCKYNHDQYGNIEGQMVMGKMASAFVKYSKTMMGETMGQLGWEKFDWMLSHQIGKKPFDRIRGMSGVRPSRMIKTFDKLGNITTATFPVNFKKLMNESGVKSGDKIGGCFAGSGIALGQFGYVF